MSNENILIAMNINIAISTKLINRLDMLEVKSRLFKIRVDTHEITKIMMLLLKKVNSLATNLTTAKIIHQYITLETIYIFRNVNNFSLREVVMHNVQSNSILEHANETYKMYILL